MAEPAGEEGNLALDGLGVLVLGKEGAVVAECGLEALVDFAGDVGLEADLLRGEWKVGVFGLCGCKGSDEVVAAAGERAGQVGVFEVDEVLGGLGGVELGLGGGAPAVWLGAIVLDGVDGSAGPDECRHVGRQVLGREAIDQHVPVGAPGEALLNEEDGKQQS